VGGAARAAVAQTRRTDDSGRRQGHAARAAADRALRRCQALRTFLGHVIDGVPEAIVEEIRAYEAAGVQEIMIDWFELDDIEGLQVLADEVLPRLTNSTPASSSAFSVGR